MEEIVITRMTEEDLDTVMRIERENFKFPWNRELFLSDLNKRFAHCLTAKKKGEVLGYIIIFQTLDEFHLANIAVDQRHQRKGIGTKLMQEMLKIAQEKKIKNIFLEVRRSNLPAQKFYERFGFFHSYTRRGYYEDGEDALVYEKSLIG